MPRNLKGGFGSRHRYLCPVCQQPVPQGTPHEKYGPYVVHPQCEPQCTSCGKTIERPAVGRYTSVVPYLGGPCHADCKKEATS